MRDFIDNHPQSMDSLNNWYRAVVSADWRNYHDIKRLFSNSVDAIGNDRFVFNVGGNNYRIIAMIFFDVRTVYIRFVGWHSEYDKLPDSSIV